MDNVPTVDAITRCKDEIARLSSEIEKLERKKNRLQWMKVGEVSYKHLCSYSEAEPDFSPDETVIGLESQLTVLNMVTGINLNDVITELCDDGSIQYLLSGSSCDVLFEVRCKELEDGHKTDGRLRITGVEIDSMEVINTELQEFLNECENRSSIGLFFSVFVPYVRCFADRRSAFSAVRQKYPEFVDFGAGLGDETLKFRSLKHQVSYEIRWTVSVSKSYFVKPALHLTVNGIDKDLPVCSRSSEMFAKMVDMMGPSCAIDSFTTSVCAGVKHE